jgi:hypothetical protein
MSARPSSKRSRSARRVSVVALAMATVVTNAIPGEEEVHASSGLLPAQAEPCPAAVPIEELSDLQGEMLSGLTVDQGTSPEPFTATVMGVMQDAIAPGFPLVIVEAHSAAIDAANGIWAGMSGSPVYTEDGRLVGSVSYGLTFGASPIAGITPAAKMYKLLSGGGPAAPPAEVRLTPKLENKLVASGAATAQQAASGMSRLPIPVAVSGVTPGRMRKISRLINRNIEGARVYAAGSASARPAAVEPQAGGNVAAALSYGDYTAAGVGTVTAVCEGEALLFGHPLLWNGSTTLSAHEATAQFVVPGGAIDAGFKVADLGGIVGTIDQDRLAGLHTLLGDPDLSTSRIHTNLTATDIGVPRAATTRVVLPEFISSAVFGHLLTNLDTVFDRFVQPGVVTLEWAARGQRADGSTWRVRRREKIADRFDVTFLATDVVAFPVDRLFNNRFEEITVDNVTVSGTADPNFKQAELIGLQKLGADGRWHRVSQKTPLRLVAGSEVFLRGVLRSFRSTRLQRVQLSFVVPRAAGATGRLSISAGADLFEFFFFEEEGLSNGGADNFAELVKEIDRAPTGDTLRADLRISRKTPSGRQRFTREARATAPTAITGNLFFPVRVVRAAA